MNNKRPINLAMTTMKFPPMAIVSILHRLSGVLLFLVIPLIFCALSSSLESQAEFEKLKTCFAHPVSRSAIWLVASALMYHLIAGVRHILMDLGFGEDVKAGRITAVLVLILAISASLILGVRLW